MTRLLWLSVAALASACDSPSFLRLTVKGIPAGTTSVVVAASLGGHDADPERFAISSTEPQTLAIKFPPALGSWLEVGVTALDANECDLGWTSHQIALRDHPGNLIDVDSALAPPITPLCNRPRSPAMEVVPEGSYSLGCSNSDPTCVADESPMRTVSLPEFEIDMFEVSVAAYADCVAANVCTVPHDGAARADGRLDQEARDYVDWLQANTYCTSFRKKRLPTEAEWEAAARGPSGSPYPWGDAQPTCDLAAFAPNTTPCAAGNQIGQHPTGGSAFGVFDLAGNVEEWVEDWYALRSSLSAAQYIGGPDTGTLRVIKGGSAYSPAADLRAAWRIGIAPDGTAVGDTPVDVRTGTALSGFRCARSPQ
jgi:formylglycine-generating enzyme required for sulfatase activity